LPHLELAREIARRFNHYYGHYLKEPQAVLSASPKVPGLDGRKMSKSYDNAIFLSDEPDVITKKVRMMVTDPARLRANDPGHPEVCSVFAAQSIFNPGVVVEIEPACRAGEIGCSGCKTKLAERLSETLAPFRSRRAEIVKEPGVVDQVLSAGLAKAKPEAEAALAEVRKRLNIG